MVERDRRGRSHDEPGLRNGELDARHPACDVLLRPKVDATADLVEADLDHVQRVMIVRFAENCGETDEGVSIGATPAGV
jgi:hypothetical protein